MTKQPSLDQKRAAYAWQKVQGQSDEYGKLAKGAPALIMNNGLMQTLAFYQDKGKPHQDKGKPHQEVLNQHIIGWLAASSLFTHQNNVPLNFNTMMEFLLKANSQQYRQATEETLALLRWIRQLAAIN